jgi:DNA-binding transcriptional LysR family regulator
MEGLEMDRLAAMELFVQIAECGSLSKAAETLDIPISTASRGLVLLEKRVSARLVDRGPRRLALTDIGQDFYQRCKNVLSEFNDAEASVQAAMVNPSGTLRITGSLSFCINHVTPVLPEFLNKYPKIDIQIVAANRYYDLLDNGIDVAFRTRDYGTDSNITVRRLAQARYVLAASAEYIKRYGSPSSVEDLVNHRLLIYSYAESPFELKFNRGNEARSIKVKSLLEANDGQVLRVAALDGLGMAIQPNYVIYDDVVAGRLIPLLCDWHLPTLPINIAYQRRKYMPSKTRAFVDFISQRFREMDFERKWHDAM